MAKEELDVTALVKETFEKHFGVTLDRLRELAEADKDGRLVVLPCKVEQLRKMLDDLTSGSSVDAGETYTTGYLYGWKNGRAELLRYILGMSDGGTREAAEAALEAMK